MSRRLAYAVLLIAAAMSLCACSSRGADPTTGQRGATEGSQPSGPGAARVATSSVDASAPGDIISVLINDEGSSRLTMLLKTSGLTDILSRKGPYTVFAPDDAAFSALEPALTQLVESGRIGWLAPRLRYHVVEGDVSPEALKRAKMLTSITGQQIRVGTAGGAIVLNGTARVLSADRASPGHVYRIDTVLTPPSR